MYGEWGIVDTSLASPSYSASFSLRSFTLVPPCWPRTVSLSSNTLSHSGGHNVYSITVPNHTFWYQSANSPVAPHDVMKMSVMVQVQTVNNDSALNNRIAWLDLIYDEHDLCGEFLAFFFILLDPYERKSIAPGQELWNGRGRSFYNVSKRRNVKRRLQVRAYSSQ